MTSSWKKSQRHPFFYFFSAIDRKTIKSWNGNFNMNPKYVVLFAFFDQTDHCGHFNFFKTLTVFTAVTQRIFVANFTFLCPVFKKIMRYVHTQPASHIHIPFEIYIYTSRYVPGPPNRLKVMFTYTLTTQAVIMRLPAWPTTRI